MAEQSIFGATHGHFSIEIDPGRAALLIIDVQYLDAHRDYGTGAEAKRLGDEARYEYYFRALEETALPNMILLLDAARKAGIEPIFVRIGSLVKDGREVSLEHKRINLIAPKHSREIDILDEIAPRDDEIVITKGASGVFNATAIDQILRNLGRDLLLVCGVVTNYCVETAVRDAGDRGYDVILVGDACAAMSEEHHRFALEILDGIYCKVRSTKNVVTEIASVAGAGPTKTNARRWMQR